MDKFRVGQKVKVVSLVNDIENNNKITTISEGKKLRNHNKVGLVECYKCNDGNFYYEKNLEPVYDGEEKSNWSECSWKPKEKIVG
jgi:hypothetical protein